MLYVNLVFRILVFISLNGFRVMFVILEDKDLFLFNVDIFFFVYWIILFDLDI